MKRFRKLLVGMATAAKQNSLRMLFAGFAWVGHYTWKVKESSRFLKRLFIAVNMPTRAIIPLDFQRLSRKFICPCVIYYGVHVTRLPSYMSDDHSLRLLGYPLLQKLRVHVEGLWICIGEDGYAVLKEESERRLRVPWSAKRRPHIRHRAPRLRAPSECRWDHVFHEGCPEVCYRRRNRMESSNVAGYHCSTFAHSLRQYWQRQWILREERSWRIKDKGVIVRLYTFPIFSSCYNVYF